MARRRSKKNLLSGITDSPYFIPGLIVIGGLIGVVLLNRKKAMKIVDSMIPPGTLPGSQVQQPVSTEDAIKNVMQSIESIQQQSQASGTSDSPAAVVNPPALPPAPSDSSVVKAFVNLLPAAPVKTKMTLIVPDASAAPAPASTPMRSRLPGAGGSGGASGAKINMPGGKLF